ncbi:MAG: hypothetical protein V3W14_00225 [Candidatus Neomarinimicrobiota bacterium]
MRTIIEPFRIKAVEPIRMTSRDERADILRKAHYNPFYLAARDVLIDLLIDTARELGLKVMLGCVVETSLASTAMGHLAGFGDYLDLDGHVLLREDPYQGLVNDYGSLRLPDAPGLGITPRD